MMIYMMMIIIFIRLAMITMIMNMMIMRIEGSVIYLSLKNHFELDHQTWMAIITMSMLIRIMMMVNITMITMMIISIIITMTMTMKIYGRAVCGSRSFINQNIPNILLWLLPDYV